ncbi:MAG TPA: DUF819 family protein [Anaerolineales bacterium]|nr:DUF819 family protein [Anaerolineales bacterium]
MELTLIASGIVIFTVWFVGWLDKLSIPWVRKALNWFPPILFAYVIPTLFTHLGGMDLSKVELHSWSRSILIPLTVLLVMSSLSIKQLIQVGAKPILLFVFGSFVIAVLPPLLLLVGHVISPAQWLVPREYWPGLVPIVGSWIGGSTSQLVLKEVVGCPEGLFLSVLVLDNIMVNLWTLLMFQVINSSDRLNRVLGIKADISTTEIIPEGNKSVYSLWYILPGAAVAIFVLRLLTDNFLVALIVCSLAGLLVGNLFPRWNHLGVIKVGTLLILTIMAILGLRLDFGGLSLPMAFVLFCVLWIILHYVLLVIAARMMNLHMAWVPIASMANVGGISTAPAVTAAYNTTLMPHAILLAIVSMVTGNLWGLITFGLLNRL